MSSFVNSNCSVLINRLLAASISVGTIAFSASLTELLAPNASAVASSVPTFTAQRVIPAPGTPPTWRYPQKVHSIPYQTRDQAMVALSPDGITLVGGDRNSLTVWDLGTRQPTRTLSSFSTLQTDASLTSLAVSPDGRLVAASLYDARAGNLRINVWNMATGKLQHRLVRRITPRRVGEQPNQPSLPENWSTIAFSPDSRRLASIAGGNPQVDLWDVATGKPIQSLRGGRGAAIAFSQDGRLLARSDGNQLLIWTLANPRNPRRLTFPGDVAGFVFSPDRRSLYVAAREAIGNTSIVVQRRDLTAPVQPAQQRPTPLAFHWSSSISFSPNAKTVIVGSPNNAMAIADLPAGQVLATPDEYFAWGSATAFSQDGSTFAVTLGNQTIQIWRMGSANAGFP